MIYVVEVWGWDDRGDYGSSVVLATDDFQAALREAQQHPTATITRWLNGVCLGRYSLFNGVLTDS